MAELGVLQHPVRRETEQEHVHESARDRTERSVDPQQQFVGDRCDAEVAVELASGYRVGGATPCRHRRQGHDERADPEADDE